MPRVRTVLYPVDFSPFCGAGLDLAVGLCRAFGARLVLHHNIAEAGPGAGRLWEWRQNHPETGQPADRRIEELRAGVPPDIEVETMVSRGPLVLGVTALAAHLPADLLVLACHGASCEEHASLTEELLGRCPCPIVAIHEGPERRHTLDLLRPAEAAPLRVLVPSDFSAAAEAAADYAFELAREFPVEVHLFHAIAGHSSAVMVPVDFSGPASFAELAVADQRDRLRRRIPPELADRCFVHVHLGRPSDAILEEAADLAPDVILMGEHARGLVRRFLTRDTGRAVLHRAHCPLWFVPPPAARAGAVEGRPLP